VKLVSYRTEDQAWIRDQTARILHRHALAGHHFRLDIDALLSRMAEFRGPADADPALRSAA
jgi:hypothetical protein